MHVTLVSGIDPGRPEAGGTRSYVLGLARRLRDLGVAVAIVSRGGAPPGMEGVTFLPVRSGPTNVRFLWRLWRTSRRLPIPPGSVLHAQRPDLLVPFLWSRRPNPTVCTLHGTPAVAVRHLRGPGFGFLYRALERYALARTGAIVAVDRRSAAWYASRHPRLAEKFLVIPVAVDTERFRPMDRTSCRREIGVTRRRAVLYAGRLAAEKRVEWIVRAARGVPDVELLVAGEGPEERRLRELAGGAPVRFLGTVPHERMPTLINACDAVVLSSVYEGMATIALESLACGVPVFSTPVGDLPQVVVPGRTGWLVTSPEELGDALRRELPEAGRLREGCVEAARPYAWEALVERMMALYRRLHEGGADVSAGSNRAERSK